ncbi:MAG TPA: type II toxin-antitoxin system HigB family toxin [Caulobacteraceae bacterium]|jgi:mRNA interferase HigB
MHVISRKRLKDFWEIHPQAEGPLRAWFRAASMAEWSSSHDVRTQFGSADFVGDRVVFDIGGNKYRLVVHIAYRFKRLLIRFVGTHEEYDRIDVKSV